VDGARGVRDILAATRLRPTAAAGDQPPHRSPRSGVLRQIGIDVIDRADDVSVEDRRIDHAFELGMAIFRLKFTMNFVMNLSNHLQIIIAVLLGGGWCVPIGQLEVGGVVAFISGIGRLNDLWGDLVNYFRDASVRQVKYRLLADAVTRLA
jgi:hypothetical protein